MALFSLREHELLALQFSVDQGQRSVMLCLQIAVKVYTILVLFADPFKGAARKSRA